MTHALKMAFLLWGLSIICALAALGLLVWRRRVPKQKEEVCEEEWR